MARKQIRGLRSDQEERKEKILRDIRPFSERLGTMLVSRDGFSIIGILMFLWLVFEPGFWPLPVLLYGCLYTIRKSSKKRDHLPMHLPATYKGVDYHNPAPGGGFKKGAGMFFLGNDTFNNNEELWIDSTTILTHMLILGTTGAGKTETLVSLSFNYLAVGSGLIYVDPKAAPKLAAQIYTMARMLGRDDDFLLINYMSNKMEEESMLKYGHTRIPLRQSNTQNPFAVGNANQLTQLLLALMPGDDNGSNSIFANNAQTLISGLMFVLVERRNKGDEELSIETIRHYLMDISEIDKLARGELGKYSETAMLALQAGLSTVGWDKSKKTLKEQPKNFPEQYSYARAYFGRALSLLVDNYGYIFRTSHGEVDAKDVITSRRIFVTMLPSLDKDPKECKSLGQICLASVRNASAVGLGDKVQGKFEDVLGALSTASKTPFGIIVDEYAAIETPGFEILLTQGRGLGMAVIVASQDYGGIKRASEGAAKQIISNCKVKIFMTMEDPDDTFNLIKALAGDGFVLRGTGFSVNKETSSSAYNDNLSVNAEKMQIVDFRDLQQQTEGDVTIAFKGDIIRGNTFYADPPLKGDQSLRLNYMLKCLAPDLTAFGPLQSVMDAFGHLAEVYQTRGDDLEKLPMDAALRNRLSGIIEIFGKAVKHPDEVRNDIGIAAVMLYGDKTVEEQDEEDEPEDDFPEGLAPSETGMSYLGETEEVSQNDATDVISGDEYEDANVTVALENMIEPIRSTCGDDVAKDVADSINVAPVGNTVPVPPGENDAALMSMYNTMVCTDDTTLKEEKKNGRSSFGEE